MYQEFFAGRDLLELPILAMMIFIATFVIVLAWVWKKGPADADHEHLANLPLEDDQMLHTGGQ